MTYYPTDLMRALARYLGTNLPSATAEQYRALEALCTEINRLRPPMDAGQLEALESAQVAYNDLHEALTDLEQWVGVDRDTPVDISEVRYKVHTTLQNAPYRDAWREAAADLAARRDLA